MMITPNSVVHQKEEDHGEEDEKAGEGHFGAAVSAPPFRRRRLGAADSALDNSAPCRFGAGHFGAVS